MDLIIKNIRTFSGTHEIPIRPLTILTGENSSGKTTCLGALAALSDPSYPFRPGFNKVPYDFGNFDTIATFKGGRAGRAPYFGLGYKRDIEQAGRSRLTSVYAQYTNHRGQLQLAEFTAEGPDF